ncbi:hypothetical protein SDC9_92352 [bioreactor metagenome]|uniref:Uncharacterized protein n=1 Tax=bioreactor metagenome TaxID=1076179 RepID=A0A644ZXW5_9ZZZZ
MGNHDFFDSHLRRRRDQFVNFSDASMARGQNQVRMRRHVFQDRQHLFAQLAVFVQIIHRLLGDRQLLGPHK